ncbi:MAG: hypothetical protein NPIRA02_36900 [Nitrospirales bacterium]|nr:MAG: hypothetical protein NPIRA02_36900 [Nitrospirales bacterium]
MIIINLLPHRTPKTPRESVDANRQFMLGIVLVLLSGTVSWGWGNSLLEQRDMVRQEKHATEQKLALLVANVEDSAQLVEKQDPSGRFTAYEQFWGKAREQQHILPILILDELSRSLEPFGIWLIALSIEEDDVVLEGDALSHGDVGLFVQALEESSIFRQWVRMETQPHVNQHDNMMQKFSLQFTAQMPRS